MSVLFNESYELLPTPLWSKLAGLQECLRCGSVVIDPKQHDKWHGSVDTNQTIVVTPRPGD